MKKKPSASTFWLSAMLFIFPFTVSAQNFFIEVLDASSFRPLPEVRVEVKSELATIVFFTSPNGEVTENIPSGLYDMTITREGYATQHRESIRVLSHELMTMTVYLDPEEEGQRETRTERTDRTTARERPARTTTRERPDRTTTRERPDRTTTRERPDRTAERERRVREQPSDRDVSGAALATKAFLEVSGQMVGIQYFGAGFGYYFTPGLYAKLSHVYGKQSYSSDFFASDDAQDIGFHNSMIGLGYTYRSPLSNMMGLAFDLDVAYGAEFLNSNNVVSSDQVNMMINQVARPGVKIGFYYSRFTLFLGVNYSVWVLDPFSQSFSVLRAEDDNQPLKWDADLFDGRGGLGVLGGIRIGF